MSLQAFERAVARLEKVFQFLHAEVQTPLAGKVRDCSEWLSSYQKAGLCFNPDADAFAEFVGHVKRAEECQRRHAVNEALDAGYAGLYTLASPALRAAHCTPLADPPEAPRKACKNEDVGGSIRGI